MHPRYRIGMVVAYTLLLFVAILGLDRLLGAMQGQELAGPAAGIWATVGGGLLTAVVAIAAGRKALKDGEAMTDLPDVETVEVEAGETEFYTDDSDDFCDAPTGDSDEGYVAPGAASDAPAPAPPMPLRSFDQALAWIKRQQIEPTQDWYNRCQMVSRMAVGAEAWAPSAREAANWAKANGHLHSGKPPAGSIAYYGSEDHGFGHATFVIDNDGHVASNDIKRRGKIDVVPYTVFEPTWGLHYRGWIDATPSGPLDIRGTQAAVKVTRVALSDHQKHLLHLVHTGEASDHQRHVAHVYRTTGKWIA